MKNPTAAILIIGNEILSGRTLDTNTQYIAKELTEIGIDLIETRTIQDDKQKIIDCVLDFSNKYTYVFTSGGIGPTHDDITSEAIASAFNLEYCCNDEAYKILEDLYHARGEKMNPARAKMAFMPQGVELITYTPPSAPGFKIKNVHVLAGVPNILQAMMRSIIPTLKQGKIVESRSIEVMMGESLIAHEFENLQNKYPDVVMGSYPFIRNNRHGTSLVLRSNDYELLNQAYNELQQIIQGKL